VARPVPPGVRWGGAPAKPVRLWLRELMLLEKMAARTDTVESPPLSDTGQADEEAPSIAPSRTR
jgi:hypothetical protein